MPNTPGNLRVTLLARILRTPRVGLALTQAIPHFFMFICPNFVEASPPEVLRAETIAGAAVLDTAAQCDLLSSSSRSFGRQVRTWRPRLWVRLH